MSTGPFNTHDYSSFPKDEHGEVFARRGMYRVKMDWDAVTFVGTPRQPAPWPGTYELRAMSFLYANPTHGSEERPKALIMGAFFFTIVP